MNKDIKQLLENAGITVTPVRLLVFKSLEESSKPLSLADIEGLLQTVDKSTISRTLTTFKGHNLVHSFNDGSGSLKYELCKDFHHDTQTHDDLHVHFRCQKCGNTFCLTSVKIPVVEIPDGFEVEEINYILTGTCSSCSAH